MDLVLRPPVSGDFAACSQMLSRHRAYPADVVNLLPEAWQRWQDEEALTASVVEDLRRPPGQGRVGFALAVFVSDEWQKTVRLGVEPFVSARTVRAELTDTISPVLRPAAIGCASEGDGLNILILHYCEAAALDEETTLALRYLLLGNFVESFRGYRIKDLVQEFWDEISPEFIVNGWGEVVTDYAGYFAKRGETAPPPGECPYLVGMDPDIARRRPGDPTAALFNYTPPLLMLTRMQKRLLREALRARTDAELAAHFNIAMATVKSHWRAIYHEATKHVPSAFAEISAESMNESRRGPEKRRYLLEYLRRHPEELCPGVNERRGRTA